MIGLGKWECKVKTIFFSGSVIVDIYDNNGEYGFSFEIGNMQIPDFTIKETKENGNTLTVTGQVDLLPGKDITAELTFTENSFDGFMKVPMLGKIKLNNCRKIG